MWITRTTVNARGIKSSCCFPGTKQWWFSYVFASLVVLPFCFLFFVFARLLLCLCVFARFVCLAFVFITVFCMFCLWLFLEPHHVRLSVSPANETPGSHSHVCPSPLVTAPVYLPLLLAVLASGIGHFHTARANSRLYFTWIYNVQEKLKNSMGQSRALRPARRWSALDSQHLMGFASFVFLCVFLLLVFFGCWQCVCSGFCQFCFAAYDMLLVFCIEEDAAHPHSMMFSPWFFAFPTSAGICLPVLLNSIGVSQSKFRLGQKKTSRFPLPLFFFLRDVDSGERSHCVNSLWDANQNQRSTRWENKPHQWSRLKHHAQNWGCCGEACARQNEPTLCHLKRTSATWRQIQNAHERNIAEPPTWLGPRVHSDWRGWPLFQGRFCPGHVIFLKQSLWLSRIVVLGIVSISLQNSFLNFPFPTDPESRYHHSWTRPVSVPLEERRRTLRPKSNSLVRRLKGRVWPLGLSSFFFFSFVFYIFFVFGRFFFTLFFWWKKLIFWFFCFVFVFFDVFGKGTPLRPLFLSSSFLWFLVFFFVFMFLFFLKKDWLFIFPFFDVSDAQENVWSPFWPQAALFNPLSPF